MKPITGTVVSSRRMPLSKAATALKKFLASDNGADQDMLAYVRRASAAFDELVEFHLDMRQGRERRAVVDDVTETNKGEEKVEVVEMDQLYEREVEKKKRKKKKKMKNVSEEEVGFVVEKEVLAADGVANGESEEDGKKSHRKKKKTTLLDGGGYEEEETSGTQHKKRRESVEEDGLGVEVDGEFELHNNDKKRKKRKNAGDGVLEEGGLSEEHHHKKKKRKVREAV